MSISTVLNKSFQIILISTILVSCSIDDAQENTENTQEDSYLVDVDFPIQLNASLYDEYLGSVIHVNDNFMWQIVGMSDISHKVGDGVEKITIGRGTEKLLSPYRGIKSDYYMLVEGYSHTYFVTPLASEKILSDRIQFDRERTGSIITLSDDSVWQITGASHYEGFTPDGTSRFSIYSGTDNMIEPYYGELSDYFMLVQTTPITFYVTPL